EVIAGFARIYPKDDKFKEIFADKELPVENSRNKKVARYILCELEHDASGNRPDYEDGDISLEHVCPVNPEQGWDQLVDRDIDLISARIGNMTLLAQAANREIGNGSYEGKLSAYRESSYKITSSLADSYPQWNLESVANRQKKMAQKACAIWRIEQLS
ncbi:MAG: HNH endonuclease family protein, partial [Betaproteobacteria bacterium]|nr:HNH endonuclease family protein [Betaproteobacteria bacterium]